MQTTLLIQKVRPAAVLPHCATEGSAGMDLCACIDAPLVLRPGERALVPTGLAVAQQDSSTVALLFARSSLGIKRGLMLTNGVGVIDSDYRGEICVGMVNNSDADACIEPQERIAQLVVVPVYTCKLLEVDDLPGTVRGSGGFGSTGRFV